MAPFRAPGRDEPVVAEETRGHLLRTTHSVVWPFTQLPVRPIWCASSWELLLLRQRDAEPVVLSHGSFVLPAGTEAGRMAAAVSGWAGRKSPSNPMAYLKIFGSRLKGLFVNYRGLIRSEWASKHPASSRRLHVCPSRSRPRLSCSTHRNKPTASSSVEHRRFRRLKCAASSPRSPAREDKMHGMAAWDGIG